MISLDYEYVNYASSRLRHGYDGYNFTSENDIIDQAFKSTSNIRLGAEFRLGLLSFRGGYAYYGKPYAKGELNENAAYSFLSGGIGFRAKSFFADLGYQYGLHEEKYMMYNMLELEETTLKSHPNKFLATFGFRF